MVSVRRHPTFPWLALIDPGPVAPGMEQFICAYVLLRRKVAVLDIGPTSSLPAVIEGLGALGVQPEQVSYLLTSHIHLDHGGGTGAALKLLPNAAAVIHPAGIPHMEKPWKLWEASVRTLGDLARSYGEPEPVPRERIIPGADGLRLDLGDGEIEVLLTPGHAPHHMSFFGRRDSLLLAGELCGVRARGIRRPAVPPPLHLDQQLESLDRAISLQPAVLTYGHFGWESDATARLRAHRQQLLAWRDTVASGARAGRTRDQMAEDIVATDPLLAPFAELPDAQKGREMLFVRNGIDGLAGYLERQATSA